MSDGQRFVRAGGEKELGDRVEPDRVHAGPDRKGGDDLAGIRVYDHDQAVVTRRKEAASERVEGESGGLVSGGQGPRRDNRVRPGVDGADHVPVLDVHVDATELRVNLGELRLSIERNRGHDHARLRVEDGSGLAAPIERVDLLPRWLVKDRVGIRSGLDLANRSQRLEVEDRRLALRAIA